MTRLAITGSPGCGKTTLAGLLEQQGRSVVDVRQLADVHGALDGFDKLDDAQVIDVAKIRGAVLPNQVVEGHMAHLLDVDEIWVIRCDPAILESRLVARGYRAGKVEENLEAEALDIILQEALETGARVISCDGSRRSPQQLLSAFQAASMDGTKSAQLEPVDWSDWLLR